MAILATTGSNALRHASGGLGVVRYWTYTKYPLGEAWEGNFPTTILLVGCNPPFAVSLYCTGIPTQKVLYHSNDVCSITNPGVSCVISWDRRTRCPPDLSAICEGGEDPPGGEVVVEKATVDLCIAVTGSFLGLRIGYDGEYQYDRIVGCVEGFWKNIMTTEGLKCANYPGYYNEYSAFCDMHVCFTGAMGGDSTTGWSRSADNVCVSNGSGGISISPDGAVSFSLHAEATNDVLGWYSGVGDDISLDDVWKCPIGSSTIPVYCIGYPTVHGYTACPVHTNCGGHPIVSLAGEITITTTVKDGSC